MQRVALVMLVAAGFLCAVSAIAVPVRSTGEQRASPVGRVSWHIAHARPSSAHRAAAPRIVAWA